MQQIIKLFLDAISPQIRQLIIDFVKDLSKRAEQTPNPWDDILVFILRTLLAIED